MHLRLDEGKKFQPNTNSMHIHHLNLNMEIYKNFYCGTDVNSKMYPVRFQIKTINKNVWLPVARFYQFKLYNDGLLVSCPNSSCMVDFHVFSFF